MNTSSSRIPAMRMPDHLPAGALQGGCTPMDPDVQIQRYDHRSTTGTVRVPAVAEPLLVWVIAGRARVEERAPGQAWIGSDVKAGDFFLTLSPEPYDMRWVTDAAGFQVLHLYIGQRLLGLAMREVHGHAAINLQEVFGLRDATVCALMTLIHAEAGREERRSALSLHGLVQALSVHLCRHYRDDDIAGRSANALPAYKLHRAVQHMTSGLAEPFSLGDLAEEAGMSTFHFSRLFHRATGLSPSQYFIRMRMERARQLLLESDLSVIEIALETGYASPSHFAHVFKRHVGVTPRGFRRG